MTTSTTTARLSEPELQRRAIEAFPESSGPGSEDGASGAVLYGQPGHPRIGKIPHLMDPELMWRERAEQEARRAAIPPEVRAAEDLIREEIRQGRRLV